MTPTPAHAHGINHDRSQYHGIMPDAYYRDLGRCETNSNLQHSTRSYTGIFGIYRGTAQRWSGRRNLATLTMLQQIRIADRIAFLGWERPGKPKVWPVGPFGWGAVRNGCGQLLEHLCHARHPKAKKHRARACQLARTHG